MPPHSRYKEIAAQIEARIKAGEWAPGSKLPRLDDLADEYGANRDTIARAISYLEERGLVWAIQGSGIVVRYGTMRPRRPRGTLVKRNLAGGSPGYSFPSASGQEVWKHHITPVASVEPLTDPRIAKLLGVEPGTPVMRRFRVTGPEGEPPFQINVSWIHPRGVDDAPEVASQAPGPGDWLYRLEKAGHWPISWMEIHRVRMPTKQEARYLEIPTKLPVLEIVRVGTSGKDGKPIEVTEYIVASDRVESIIVLQRDESAQEPWPEEVEDAPAAPSTSLALGLEAAARTHVGLVRQRNEDASYTGRWLFAVADGLGGHVAGDVASATAIEALRTHDRQVAPDELTQALGRAVGEANEALRRKVETTPEVAGMGTTLVALLWSGGTTAALANIGDSRAYLLRTGDDDPRTVQITEDHVYGRLIAEATSHPALAERLTRFLDGRADGRSPDITTWDLRPGDRFLLCSDGLSSVVPHELIHEALTASGSPEQTADRLVQLAMDHGAPDNVTALVIDVSAHNSAS